MLEGAFIIIDDIIFRENNNFGDTPHLIFKFKKKRLLETEKSR